MAIPTFRSYELEDLAEVSDYWLYDVKDYNTVGAIKSFLTAFNVLDDKPKNEDVYQQILSYRDPWSEIPRLPPVSKQRWNDLKDWTLLGETSSSEIRVIDLSNKNSPSYIGYGAIGSEKVLIIVKMSQNRYLPASPIKLPTGVFVEMQTIFDHLPHSLRLQLRRTTSDEDSSSNVTGDRNLPSEKVDYQQKAVSKEDSKATFEKHVASINRLIEIWQAYQGTNKHPTEHEIQECAAIWSYILADLVHGHMAEEAKNLACGLLFLGAQGVGKSTLLSSLAGVPIGDSGGGMQTRRPLVIIKFTKKNAELQAIIDSKTIPIHQVAGALKKVNEKTKDSFPNGVTSEPFTVLIESPNPGTMYLIDLPGLIGATLGEKGPIGKELEEISFKTINDYVRHRNAQSLIIALNKLSDARDLANITWDKVLGDSTGRVSEELKDKIVVVFTNGISGLQDMIKQQAFRDCKNWEDVERVLFSEIRKLLHKDVPIFITALDGSTDTVEFEHLCKAYGAEQALFEWKARNDEAHNQLKKTVEVIGSLTGFQDTKEGSELFMKHIGVDNLRDFIQGKQREAFLKNSGAILKLTTEYLGEINETRKKLEERLSSESEMQPDALVDSFYLEFRLLLSQAMTGAAETSDLTWASERIIQDTPKISSRDSYKEFGRILSNASLSIREEVKFAEFEVPDSAPCKFPFPSDKDEAEFLSLIDKGKTQNIGIVRMRILLKLLMSYFQWFVPKTKTADDWLAQTATFASQRLVPDAMIRAMIIEDLGGLMWGENGVAYYIARRMVAIRWHCVQSVLSYLSTQPKYTKLISNLEFMNEFEVILKDRFYSSWVTELKDKIIQISEDAICRDLDFTAPSLAELRPSFLHYDEDFIKVYLEDRLTKTNSDKLLKERLSNIINTVSSIKRLKTPLERANMHWELSSLLETHDSPALQKVNELTEDVVVSWNNSYERHYTQRREALLSQLDSYISKCIALAGNHLSINNDVRYLENKHRQIVQSKTNSEATWNEQLIEFYGLDGETAYLKSEIENISVIQNLLSNATKALKWVKEEMITFKTTI